AFGRHEVITFRVDARVTGNRTQTIERCRQELECLLVGQLIAVQIDGALIDISRTSEQEVVRDVAIGKAERIRIESSVGQTGRTQRHQVDGGRRGAFQPFVKYSAA